jgi:hypothetical protein
MGFEFKLDDFISRHMNDLGGPALSEETSEQLPEPPVIEKTPIRAIPVLERAELDVT